MTVTPTQYGFTIEVGCEIRRDTVPRDRFRGAVCGSYRHNDRPPSIHVVDHTAHTAVEIVLDDADTIREIIRMLERFVTYEERCALNGRNAVVPSEAALPAGTAGT